MATLATLPPPLNPAQLQSSATTTSTHAGNPTTRVPLVIVSEDGKLTLETSLDVDEPLSHIASQIQEKFHVCPPSQMLKYNGDLLQSSLSLQQNGALLLRGEPYLKLMLQVSRGQMAALQISWPSGRIIPMSISEKASVVDLKHEICEMAASLLGHRWSVKEMRLLYRGQELHDTAQIDYYHLPNQARVDVVRKPDVGAGEYSTVRTKDVPEGVRTSQRAASARARNEPAVPLPPASASKAARERELRARPAAKRIPPAVAPPSRRQNVAMTPPAEHMRERVVPRRTAATPAYTRVPQELPPRHTTSNRPRSYYEEEERDEDDDDVLEEEAMRDVSQSVRRLEDKIRALKEGTPYKKYTAREGVELPRATQADAFMEAKLKAREDKIKELEEKNALAQSRIAELEENVHRLQQLLTRVAGALP